MQHTNQYPSWVTSLNDVVHYAPAQVDLSYNTAGFLGDFPGNVVVYERHADRPVLLLNNDATGLQLSLKGLMEDCTQSCVHYTAYLIRGGACMEDWRPHLQLFLLGIQLGLPLFKLCLLVALRWCMWEHACMDH